MSLLARYIFLRHARLLLLIMCLGLGLYLLTEIVEKVDIFIDNGAGLDLVLRYFACRLPGIIAQILPAVFLLATYIFLYSPQIFFFFLAVMQNLWDLSSLTRNRTRAPCSGSMEWKNSQGVPQSSTKNTNQPQK